MAEYHHAQKLDRMIACVAVILAILSVYRVLFVSFSFLAMCGLLAVVCLDNRNVDRLGLHLRPRRGWIYWFRLAALFAGIIAAASALCAAVWWTCGWKFPEPYRSHPSWYTLIFMCIEAPVSEEILYRGLLMLALLPMLGEWGTIIVGGIVFAAIHVVAGNPGPDNQLAGFLLGWTFLRSRCLPVPIAMHAAGNLLAYLSQVAAWYYLPPSLGG